MSLVSDMGKKIDAFLSQFREVLVISDSFRSGIRSCLGPRLAVVRVHEHQVYVRAVVQLLATEFSECDDDGGRLLHDTRIQSRRPSESLAHFGLRHLECGLNTHVCK